MIDSPIPSLDRNSNCAVVVAFGLLSLASRSTFPSRRPSAFEVGDGELLEDSVCVPETVELVLQLLNKVLVNYRAGITHTVRAVVKVGRELRRGSPAWSIVTSKTSEPSILT